MKETQEYGFDKVRMEQQELGIRVRALLAGKGIKSVAAEGFQTPGVVASYIPKMRAYSPVKNS